MKIKTSLLLTASVFAVGALAQSPAYAQQAAGGAPESVVVTGTRIQTQGFTSPTPTTVVGTQQVEDRAAVSITDILFDIPSIPNSTTGIGTSNAGQSAINLRGLSGQNSRTLVLIDGQRPSPTNQYGAFDTSVIPTELVQRTDIVTGGASAAYGSDAIAGVVNIVLRDKLVGFRGNLQYATSQRGDNISYKGSLGWGTSFMGDRGQVMIAGEYSNQYAPQTDLSRGWSSQHTAFTTQTINGITYTNVATPNLQLKNLTYGGVIIGSSTSLTAPATGSGPISATSPLAGIQFGANGQPVSFSYGNNPAITSNTYNQGASGPWENTDGPVYLGTSSLRRNVFGRVTFQVTDDIKAFVEGGNAYSDVRAIQAPIAEPGGAGTNNPIEISQSNPYLQALTTPLPGSTLTLLQTMQKNNIQTIAIGRLMPEFGRYSTTGQTNVAAVTAGASGSFWDTGKWSVSANYGGTFSLVKFTNNLSEPNLRAALDPIAQNGQIVCNPAVIAQDGADAGCVPINPFGAGSISQAAANYVDVPDTNHITNRQISVGGSVQDNIVDLWAGPIIGSVGGEWREVSLSSITSRLFNLLPANGTNAPLLNLGQNNSGGADNANPKTIPLHKEDVGEGFVEVLVPLLAPSWNLGDASVDVAGRAARNSVNRTNATSWKVGVTYSPSYVPGFLLRGTHSQDTRAPNLSELFSGANIQGGNFTGAANSGTAATQDPLLPGKAYSYTTFAPGNPALKTEIGRTTTFGFAYEPDFWGLDGLGFSVDRYDIKIDRQIASPGGGNIILGCYGQGVFAAAGPQQQFCQYITRAPGAGVQNIASVNNVYLNLGAAHQEGFDFEVHYASDLDRFIDDAPGHINLRFLATDDQSDTTKTFANLPTIVQNIGRNGSPEWKVTVSSTYTLGAYSFNMENRYVDSTRYVLDNTSTTANTIPYLNPNVNAWWLTNIQLAYAFDFTAFDDSPKHVTAYLNINNLFDNDPATIYGTGNTPGFTSNNTYDIIGRAFRVGVRFNGL